MPVAVLGVWFALAGSLRASVDGFYLINRRYTVPNPVTDSSTRSGWTCTTAYGVTVWLLLGGLVALALRSLRVCHDVPGARTPPWSCCPR